MANFDNRKRNYKCGPNWIPSWLFDEPIFNVCCTKHDIAWKEQTGKLSSDIALLKCCWKIASQVASFWWRLRAKTQAILMFLILVIIPFSYMWYWMSGINNK